MSSRFNPPPNWPAPPAGWTPPAGWQPDPSWGPAPEGWPLWVEDSYGAPAASGYGHIPPQGQGYGAAQPQAFASVGTLEPPKKKKVWPAVVGGIIVLSLLGSCMGGNDDEPAASTPTATATEPAKTTEKAAAAAVTQPAETVEAEETAAEETTAAPVEPAAAEAPSVGPKAQQAFLAGIAKSAAAYSDASTELKRTKVVTDRDKAACAATGGKFNGWEGEITTIGSNNDGHAHITVKVGDDVELATWNNALSDIGDDTLIQSGTKLWEKLLEMEEGATVLVSGEFVDGDNTCVETSNLTETFNAASPDFVTRFTDVTVK
ncbi:hypothetical protein ACX8Z9_08180 [Arthrobacter halodurans]|uniref:Uncharacterized protein n=1 Tax=Arthrobacter halodurans TaxID=516699 RepID=A0ABV4UK76_9MICC